MTTTPMLPEMHPDWPEIFARECVRAHLNALVYRIYWDLSQGIEYRLVAR